MGIKLKNKNYKKKTNVDLQSDTHKELDRLTKRVTSMGNIQSKAVKETNRLVKYLRALLH